jgi:hypothetical protein
LRASFGALELVIIDLEKKDRLINTFALGNEGRFFPDIWPRGILNQNDYGGPRR